MFSLRAKFLALLAWLAQPERLKLRLFLEGNLIGVLTGLVVAAFRYLLVCSEEINTKLANIKLAALGVKIDELTPEQRRYLNLE